MRGEERICARERQGGFATRCYAETILRWYTVRPLPLEGEEEAEVAGREGLIGGEPFVKVRQETGGIPVRPSLAAPGGLIESIPEVADDHRIGLGKSIDGNTPLPVYNSPRLFFGNLRSMFR